MSAKNRPTVEALRDLGEAFERLAENGRGRASYRARGVAIAAALVFALGLASLTPPGRALAEQVSALFEGADDNPDGLIPAESCPPEVIEAYAEQGLRFDTYSSCSDLEQAIDRARSINHMRRNGLTRLLEGMREHGAPADVQAPLAEELEELGGPWVYPRNR